MLCYYILLCSMLFYSMLFYTMQCALVCTTKLTHISGRVGSQMLFCIDDFSILANLDYLSCQTTPQQLTEEISRNDPRATPQKHPFGISLRVYFINITSAHHYKTFGASSRKYLPIYIYCSPYYFVELRRIIFNEAMISTAF
jgi:hypothetical protein